MDLSDFWRKLLASLAAVVVFGLAIYLGKAIRQIETLEETLEYRKPALSGAEATVSADLQRTYVPAYSHIYTGGGSPRLLEITLSVRNPDPQAALTLHNVSYYGGDGELLDVFLTLPKTLPPRSAANYLVAKGDIRGGSGASFEIHWSVETGANPPLIEAVMIGNSEDNPVAFTSRGFELSSKIENTSMEP